ncbi:hypothetical protein [Mesorhizobium sp. M0771]|uniref:hypothetical protein n=1 Tax=Mesorhizobium sp. M0771 TaxID=2956997 RepID=UPI003335B0EA
MSDAIQALDSGGVEARSATFGGVWKFGLYAAAAWAATAVITVALPDVVPWGTADLFAILTAVGAAIFAVLAFSVGCSGGSAARSCITDRRSWRSVSGSYLGIHDREIRLAAEALLLTAARPSECLCR